MKESKNYDVPAARKAVGVMELLCDCRHPMGVSEISQELGINKNMVFRLLKTLTDLGWIVQIPGETKYRMGLRAFHFTSKPVNRMSLKAAAAGPLMEIWEELGESTYLGILDKDRVLYLEHLDGTGDVKIAGAVGGRYYLHASAPGKVLLAYSDESVLDLIAGQGLVKMTPYTLTDKESVQKDLEQIRKQGYAVDRQEYSESQYCFAVPIFNYENRIVGTIGITVLNIFHSLEDLVEKLGPKVVEAGRKISTALGGDLEV